MRKNDSKHATASPIPWLASGEYVLDGEPSGNAIMIADCSVDLHPPRKSKARREANAARIAKAVNVHDELVKALRFYAEERRYSGSNHRPLANDEFTKAGAPYMQDVHRDHGELARAALAKI